jgi:transporter family-2 protein
LVVLDRRIARFVLRHYDDRRVAALGRPLTFALIVGGQTFAALLIDQLGLFGLDRTPLSLSRVVGAAMLVGAVILIRR